MRRRIFLILIFMAIPVAYLFSKQVGPGSSELERFIESKAFQWGLDPALVKAIAKVESNWDPNAKNPHDPSYGLMQITPALAFDFGLISDWRNPSSYEIQKIMDVNNNLDVACWFLDHLTSTHPFDAAVQMYNVGEAGYQRGTRNTAYLNKVRSYYEKYSA